MARTTSLDTAHKAIERPDLSGYEVEFRQDAVFGFWTYTVKTPDGAELIPLFGSFMDKHNAERSALKRIERHQATETMSASDLRARVQA